ncbi:MAG: DUF1836 domain-containing protein [Clostridia bacterium]|jgi:DNA-binding transcriptional MerR regulator|nr:DUF1836 domain-containing protein [Clostridiaceae bacterium]
MTNFDRNEIIKIFEETFGCKSIDPDSIPDIDLYVDQVTTFIENRLGSLKRNDEDKMLTKTMINNYTKEGILFPPVLKKYTRNHMKMLIMIYYLKQVLSINDIKAILKPLSDRIKSADEKDAKAGGKRVGEDSDHDFIDKMYETFIRFEEAEKNAFQADMASMTEKIEGMDLEWQKPFQVLLLVVDLVLQAYMRKTMAEKLIDTYFTEEVE